MTPDAGGRRFGLHRVLEPPGSFPQPALRLDATSATGEDECLVAVETLHVDSASFFQLSEANGGDPARIAAAIEAIVAERGKLHNPVTGSGGMLVGTAAEVGSAFRAERGLEPGARVASLISLTLTPLALERVEPPRSPHVTVHGGRAILFLSSPFARLPDDLPTALALAALDVAGAPSRVATLVREGMRVCVLGAGGTSGLLSLHAIRRGIGDGTLVAVERSPEAREDIVATGLADHVLDADATDALALRAAVLEATGGEECDLTVNVVNVPGTETGSVLVTRPDGTVLFFSMATSFTASALGAEGLGRETTLLIGNGHMPDQGATALGVLRESPAIRAILARRLG